MSDLNQAPDTAFERLTKACLDLLPDMPSGFEPAGQDMGTTMRQARIREWHKALMAATKELTLGTGAEGVAGE